MRAKTSARLSPSGSESQMLNASSSLSRPVPPGKRGIVPALSAKQHYVRVHTARGNDLFLTRLADAIDQFKAEASPRIHRSHWVRKAAAQEMATREGRPFLRLLNGPELPVSRSYSGAVKEAFP
ncbi:MAG: LytTR family DNA-binding domain-containing protein [Rhodobacter sp.]|nr:LytTR family DNA-binding domain-containing protein [Rhodobacter sp.]